MPQSLYDILKRDSKNDPFAPPPEIADPFAPPPATPPSDPGEYNVAGGLKTLAGSMLRLPEQVAAKAVTAWQGKEGASVADKDAGDRLVQWVNERHRKRQKTLREVFGDQLLAPGIKVTDAGDLAQNLGFSGTSAVAGVATGLATAVGTAAIPGGQVAAPYTGWTAGTAAAGASAYQMAGYEIMSRYLEAVSEDRAAKGQKAITKKEEELLKKDFTEKAHKYGLWEAIPEAIGQATGLKIISTPLKSIFGKSIGRRFVGKLGSLYGAELTTEAVTEIGQDQTLSGTKVGTDKPLEWTRSGAFEALKRVAPQTILLTSVMGGAGYIGSKAYEKQVRDPKEIDRLKTIAAEGHLDDALLPDKEFKKIFSHAKTMAEKYPQEMGDAFKIFQDAAHVRADMGKKDSPDNTAPMATNAAAIKDIAEKDKVINDPPKAPGTASIEELEAQLSRGQQAAIQNHVGQIGSVEAVDQAFQGDDIVPQYARAFARLVSPRGEQEAPDNKQIPPEKEQALPVNEQIPPVNEQPVQEAVAPEQPALPTMPEESTLIPGPTDMPKEVTSTPGPVDMPVQEVAPQEPQKQPWEMTKQEFSDHPKATQAPAGSALALDPKYITPAKLKGYSNKELAGLAYVLNVPVSGNKKKKIAAITDGIARLEEGSIDGYRDRLIAANHYMHIRKALEDGKPVPDGILKEHEDLAGSLSQVETTQTADLKNIDHKKGSTGTSYLPDNTPVEFQYVILDVDELITSHDDSFRENEEFPAELQPRDRARAAMKIQISELNNKLNPQRLAGDSSVSQGAPVIGPDLVVESGNGRTMAIRKGGPMAKKYHEWVKSVAKDHGITDDISMENPVLVRLRTSEIASREEFVKEANRSDVAKMSDTEQAMADAGSLTQEDLQLFRPGVDGDIGVRSNQSFVNRFVSKLPIGEQNSYLTEDGRANQALAKRIQAAIFFKAYQDEALLQLIAEETSPDIQRILSALTVAGPRFAKARAMDANLGGINIVSHVVSATNFIQEARREFPDLPSQPKKGDTPGMSKIVRQVTKHLDPDQMELFERPKVTGATRHMAIHIAENAGSAKRMGELLTGMADGVIDYLKEAPQGLLFGEELQKPKASDIITQTISRQEHKYEDKQQDLFGRNNAESSGEGKRPRGGRAQDQDARTPDKDAGQGRAGAQKQTQKVAEPGAGYGRNSALQKPEKGFKEKFKFTQLEFDFKPKKKRDPLTGAISTPRVRIATTGYIKAHSSVVNTPEDAAALLAKIRKSAQEYLYSITTDKDGNVLEIHKYTKGVAVATQVRLSEFAGRALNIPDAKTVYMVHNHPTGDTVPSPDDQRTYGRFVDILALNDINTQALIIGGTDWVTFDEAGSVSKVKKLRPTVRMAKLPVKERQLRAPKSKPTKIQRPQDVKKYLTKHHPDQEGILLQDATLSVIDFIPWPKGMPVKKAAAKVIGSIESTNAAAMVVAVDQLSSGRSHFIIDVTAGLGGDIMLNDIVVSGKFLNDTNELNDLILSRGHTGNMKALNSIKILRESVSGIPVTDAQKYYTDEELAEFEINAKGLNKQLTQELDAIAGTMAPSSAGVSTVAQKISKDFKANKRIDFRGHKAETAQDIAVLAQVYRDPRYETFRIFYVKDNQIVAHEGVSSRMPSNTAAFKTKTDFDGHVAAGRQEKEIHKINDRIKRLKADGYYLLHNHPTGDVSPSIEDVGMSEYFYEKVPGYKGHVIINGTQYFHIPAGFEKDPTGGFQKVPDIPENWQDPLLNNDPEHSAIGEKITSTETVAQIALSLKTRPGYVALSFLDAKGVLTAIQEVPKNLLKNAQHGADFLRGRARAFGATSVVGHVFTDKKMGLTDMRKPLNALMANGSLGNVIYQKLDQSGQGNLAAEFAQEMTGEVFGKKTISGHRVHEDTKGLTADKESGKKDTADATPQKEAHDDTADDTTNEQAREDAQRLQSRIEKYLGRKFQKTAFPPEEHDDSLSGLGGIARTFGRRLTLFRIAHPDIPPFDGVTFGDGVVYINAEAVRPHLWNIGHELYHEVSRDPNHADIFALFTDSTLDQVQNFDAYKNAYLALLSPENVATSKIPSDSEIHNELFADFMGDQFMNPGFLADIQKNTDIPPALSAPEGHAPEVEQYFKDPEMVRAALLDALTEYAKRQKATRVAAKRGDGPLFSRQPVEAPTTGPALTEEIRDDRSYANKIFEQRDVAIHHVRVETKELQKKVQALSGMKSRRTATLGFAYDSELKRSNESDTLDMALMVHRDIGSNPEKIAEFREWAKEAKTDPDISAAQKLRINDQLDLLNRVEGLTDEQKALADDLGERFDQAFSIALANKVVGSFQDNYVRRLWNFPESKKDKVTGSPGGYGFKVTTTARKNRVLDTIIDGWMEGYDLKIKGITSSYGAYMEDLESILANRDFILSSYNTRDLDGKRLFSTSKYKDYEALKHPSFSLWEWAGSVKTDTEPDGSGALVINDKGRKFFYGAIDHTPETWAVYKVTDGKPGKRAVRVFLDEKSADAFVQGRKYDTDIKYRKPKEHADVWEKRELYAPKELSGIINKMVGSEGVFSSSPGLKQLARFNSAVKSYVLMSSFFHHIAGARSWMFGVHHGWYKKELLDPVSGKKLTSAGMNPVAAYKSGMKKIMDRHALVDMGIRNGLTLGEIQDWSENLLREDKGYTETLVNKLGLKTTSKVLSWGRLKRENFTDALFKQYFAGLKAEAFVMEFVHELNKAQKKGDTATPEQVAERVARLINADFGGLHLQRMGRNPTLQKVGQLLLLAPDWTESNFRTVTGMIPGVNNKIDELMGAIPGPKGMDKVYRNFWGKVMFRIAAGTIMAQLLLNGGDDSEEFWKEQALSDRFQKFRWTEVDITKIYNAIGIDLDGARKTISIGGHFFDPLKAMELARLIKHKGSPVVKIAGAVASGNDWAERPFTDVGTLLTTGKTIKKSPYEKEENFYTRLPSIIVNQVISLQPIQVGYFLQNQMGELDGLSMVLQGAGVSIHNAWVPRAQTPIAPGDDRVDRALSELSRHGLKMGPPGKNITVSGMPQKLTNAQYDDYFQESTRIARRKLTGIMSRPGWKQMKPERRAKLVKKVISAARKQARAKLKRKLWKNKNITKNQHVSNQQGGY